MKRMFDKEEIVDIIQEESPKVEVDSELSETSENPVQNKVIYEALENAGKTLYQHNITLKWDVSAGAVVQKFRVNLIILTSNDTPYTNISTLETYIKSIITASASGVYWPQLIVNGIEISTTDNFSTVKRALIVGLGIQTGSDHVNFYGYKFDESYGEISYSFLSSYSIVKDTVIEL